TCRPVDELVRYDEAARAEFGPQAADGARRDHLARAHRAQRPQVRAVGDAVRREAVVAAVARQEGDAAVLHRGAGVRVGRWTVWRVDEVLGRVVQKGVEA